MKKLYLFFTILAFYVPFFPGCINNNPATGDQELGSLVVSVNSRTNVNINFSAGGERLILNNQSVPLIKTFPVFENSSESFVFDVDNAVSHTSNFIFVEIKVNDTIISSESNSGSDPDVYIQVSHSLIMSKL